MAANQATGSAGNVITPVSVAGVPVKAGVLTVPAGVPLDPMNVDDTDPAGVNGFGAINAFIPAPARAGSVVNVCGLPVNPADTVPLGVKVDPVNVGALIVPAGV